MDVSKSDSDQTISLPTPIKANAMLAKDFFAKLSYEVSKHPGGISITLVSMVIIRLC